MSQDRLFIRLPKRPSAQLSWHRYPKLTGIPAPTLCPSMVETPLEVVEIILSILYRDTTTLSRCSLVSRDWLPFCRRWLFEEADLTIHGFRSVGGRHSRLFKFMELTSSTSPCTFTNFVQRLRIDSSFTPYHIAGLDTIDLPKLHSICITNSQAAGIPSYLLSAISTVFAERVDDLDIARVRFLTNKAMIKFICSFKNLEKLSLGSNFFVHFPLEGAPQADIHPDLRLAPNLRSLHISSGLVFLDDGTRGWLLEQLESGCKNLRKFEIECNDQALGIAEFPEFLAAISDRVEGVTLRTRSRKGPEEIKALFSSQDMEFPNLRLLCLNCRVSEVKAPSISGLNALPISLGREGMDITLNIEDAKKVDATLGRLIGSLKAPCLKKIVLTLSHRSSYGTCTAHTLKYISFPLFDKALAEKGPGSLPMLRAVEFIADGCTGRLEGGRCFVLRDIGMVVPIDADSETVTVAKFVPNLEGQKRCATFAI
ncbi:hypothetical protein DFP72DRAFT_1136410 [Ephemerocybe angulata]|uniref:F-box domain-containing protein n=1 Tax=Ephemerocybe angulata TaxID=980116 RepID=A0A8H6IH43_9AGAR|nr:hypothetical protein DFP72DRAFT_1136410 [Tulosesus angulatus]